MSDTDIIYTEKIKKLLKTDFIAKEIALLETMDSTNNHSLILAKQSILNNDKEAKDKTCHSRDNRGNIYDWYNNLGNFRR